MSDTYQSRLTFAHNGRFITPTVKIYNPATGKNKVVTTDSLKWGYIVIAATAGNSTVFDNVTKAESGAWLNDAIQAMPDSFEVAVELPVNPDNLNGEWLEVIRVPAVAVKTACKILAEAYPVIKQLRGIVDSAFESNRDNLPAVLANMPTYGREMTAGKKSGKTSKVKPGESMFDGLE